MDCIATEIEALPHHAQTAMQALPTCLQEFLLRARIYQQWETAQRYCASSQKDDET